MTINFEEHRSHLRDVAYRLLGSLAEADDAVQEAWLRLDRAEPTDIANPRGWLTTVVSRICLDMLRSRAFRKEESLSLDDRATATDAAHELMLADSVGRALLVILDKLEPAERIAFVLHDLFGMPFDEIAAIVSRSPDATRQLASRARRRVQGSRLPEKVLDSQRRVIQSFVAALRSGNLQGLIAILDPDIVVHFDDEVPEIRGREKAADNWVKGATAFAQFADMFTLSLVDGSVGLVMAPKGRPVRVLRFAFDEHSSVITRADIIADRTELDALEIESLPT